MRLGDLSWPDVGNDPPVVVVPVGSCEQHGPHLPLGTDALIAEALARRLADRRAGTVLGPTLGITASGEHAGFAGTLSIGTTVMEAVVVELVRSADWARGVVLVNGHGGNRDALDAAFDTLHGEGRRVLSWWPAVDGGDAHAGETETSIMLALRPDLVQRERAAPGETAPLSRVLGRLRAGGVSAVSSNGVLGDPTTASSRRGTQLLDELGDDLAAAYDRWISTR